MIGPHEPNISALLGLTPSTPSPTGSSGPVNGKLICFFVSQGEPLAAVAKKLGVPLEQVEMVVNSQSGSELIIRLQTALFPDVRVRIQKMTHVALDTKFRILTTSTNDALKDKVATDILDRSLGKATQVTENRNVNFDVKDAEALQRQLDAGRERLDKIDSMKRALAASLPVTVPPKQP